VSQPGVIGRFLDAMVAHDWASLGLCVDDKIERIGPYGDTYRGRDEYVAFISALMPTLGGYHMEIDRISYDQSGRLAFAELTETVEVDGSPLRTPEVLVFEIGPDGLITHITIYIQQRPRR
jgi:hypothetical protein